MCPFNQLIPLATFCFGEEPEIQLIAMAMAERCGEEPVWVFKNAADEWCIRFVLPISPNVNLENFVICQLLVRIGHDENVSILIDSHMNEEDIIVLPMED